MPKILKGVFKKTFQNPNSRISSNYFIVEELSQTPCVMLALVVLQSCPSQRDALLEAIHSMDSMSLLVKFNLFDVKILLPYHVALSIDVVHGGKNIRSKVVDEGTSMFMISMSCWKSLGSPELVPSNTVVIDFDGSSFHP